MYLPRRKTKGRLALRILAFAVDVLPESIKKDYAEDLAEAWLSPKVKPCQAVSSRCPGPRCRSIGKTQLVCTGTSTPHESETTLCQKQLLP